MPRRILLLITDLKIGGTPTVVRELAFRLHQDPDFQVHVACLDRWGPVADQLRDRGVPLTALNACCSLDARVLRRLVKLVRDQDIHTVFSFLVHANSVAAVASRFLPGVKFIQSIQTTQPNPRWHWKVQHFAASAAEKIVVPSLSVVRTAAEWSGIDERKIVVIPNAIDLSRTPIPRQPQTGKRVGFIGRLDPIKRVDDLIRAMPLLAPDVSLDIWGEGVERAKIEALVTELSLKSRVKLHGAVLDISEAYRELDVLVLPSESEGFGLVLIEAMAAGVPVVGTNVPGIQDVIVDAENGLLAPPRDPHALVGAINRLFDDVTLRDRLINGGLKSVRECYTWERVFDMYRELLTDEGIDHGR